MMRGLKRIIHARRGRIATKRLNNNINNYNNRRISLFPYSLLIIAGMSLFSYKHAYNAVLEESKQAYIESVAENQELYPELFYDYNAYANLIASEIRSCRDDKVILKDFALYNTLLNNGYISLGDDFIYNEDVSIDINGMLGANVAIGEGVCRHASVNLCDVFNIMGYDARVVGGKLYKKGEKEPSGNNHAVVYVSDGKESYILDPINQTIFLRKGAMEYYMITSQEDDHTIFKPDDNYVSKTLGELDSSYLRFDLKNKFRKHWKILKQYREYEEYAEQFLEFFKEYEKEYLEQYENSIQDEIKSILF